MTDEFLEFWPGHRRVRETPPSPLGRKLLGTLLAFCATMLVWGIFGQLDIVAVAQGRLVPRTYLKIVQPAESGIVKEILVREGDAVRQGQPLMRLDGTDVRADRATLVADRHRLTLTLRRIDAELADSPFFRHQDDPADLFAGVQAQFQANRLALANAVAEQRALLEKARHELSGAVETRTRMVDSLAHYRDQDEAYGRLGRDGHVPRLLVTDKHRERQEKERELNAQEFAVQGLKADIVRVEKRIIQVRADDQRNLRAERVETMSRLAAVEQALTKEDRRNELLELTAPQDGVVKDLATHTVGTVVSPGTIVMTLVPGKEELLAEVWIQNEDIGFVAPGQPAVVKLGAFAFQKYGMLDGMVERVGPDANAVGEGAGQGERGEGAPLVYKSTIGLATQHLLHGGQSYPLLPGMQVSAEIRLGQRSVLEYLLSPVTKAVLEACRER
ncbi:MAG: HlyD family type I secretion periplasmic adaptor subunit [Desulfovibrionales bacterium]|nr:HlyD family type I secretion periplasmic adaptor subunit [Desulfovibrionales bacterium]